MRRLVILGLVSLALGLGLLGYFLRKPAATAAAGPEIILYSGTNFTGHSLRVTGTLYDMPKVKDQSGEVFDWNDQVRSLVVLSGTWRLYQHGRSNTLLDDTKLEVFDVRAKEPAAGWSCLLSATSAGPLEIPAPAACGLDRDVSSIELVAQENLPDWALAIRK